MRGENGDLHYGHVYIDIARLCLANDWHSWYIRSPMHKQISKQIWLNSKASRFYPLLFVGELVSYLCYFFLLAYWIIKHVLMYMNNMADVL